MGLNQVASVLFSMRFGTGLLRKAKMPYRAIINHADGSETTFDLTTHSDFPRTIENYLTPHFSLDRDDRLRDRNSITEELMRRFNQEGISSMHLYDIAYIAFAMAGDICPFDIFLALKGSQGIDKSKLTVKYFEEGAKRMPQHPTFVSDQETFPQFLDRTGQWLHGRFEEVPTNVSTGSYLAEQEMR